MLWVKKGTHIIDHPRFLEAGAVARDLYDWGMLYAGKHETDGELPMVAVLASAWGAGGAANIKIATKLVDVGLWARTDSGFSIYRWAEQGNETKATLTDKRKDGRERKARSDARRNGVRNGVTHSVTPSVSNAKGSTSTSLSGSDLGSEIASELPTGVRERVVEPITPTGEPPPWFLTALDVVGMNTGIVLPPGEAWLRYEGHRAGKGIEPTAKDAQYWLTTVMVPEAREVLRRASRDKERDAKFDRDKRFAKDGPERPQPTPEQAKQFAENLSARLLGSRKVGT